MSWRNVHARELSCLLACVLRLLVERRHTLEHVLVSRGDGLGEHAAVKCVRQRADDEQRRHGLVSTVSDLEEDGEEI